MNPSKLPRVIRMEDEAYQEAIDLQVWLDLTPGWFDFESRACDQIDEATNNLLLECSDFDAALFEEDDFCFHGFTLKFEGSGDKVPYAVFEGEGGEDVQVPCVPGLRRDE